MIPLAIPIAVAAGSAVAGGFGMKAAMKNSGANKTLDDAMARVMALESPTEDDLKYELDKLVSQGEITPEVAKSYLMDKTAYSDISVDPTVRAAQTDALKSLQDISKEGGLTAIDRSKIDEIISRTGQEERGAREAIVQNQRAMGRGGSGLELAAMLENQQGAATRASQQGTDVAALAQQRALEALTQGANLGGQMEERQFGEASKVAEAKDALTKFNLQNLQSTEEQNVARRQAAATANLSEKQRIADTNVDLTNKGREIGATARQTAFENELAKNKAANELVTAKATAQEEAQKRKAGFVGNLVGAGGSVVGGAMSKLSDETKKDVSPKAPDLDAFMESLTPALYKYKDPTAAGAQDGEEVGVMAQDVEKSPVGRTMVKNTSGGKMLDMQKGFGVILAALAALHDKIDGDTAAA